MRGIEIQLGTIIMLRVNLYEFNSVVIDKEYTDAVYIVINRISH